jgi:hypothetical protein
VTIAEMSRDVRVVHRRLPNGGSWSFFSVPLAGGERVLRLLREARMLALRRPSVSVPAGGQSSAH